MSPVHGNGGSSNRSSDLDVDVLESDALAERTKSKVSFNSTRLDSSPLLESEQLFQTYLVSSSSPNHVVLGVELGRPVGIQPSLRDEGVRLGVDLLVVKRRPG